MSPAPDSHRAWEPGSSTTAAAQLRGERERSPGLSGRGSATSAPARLSTGVLRLWPALAWARSCRRSWMQGLRACHHRACVPSGSARARPPTRLPVEMYASGLT